MNEQSRMELTQAFNGFVSKVFGWMFLALLVTAGTAFLTEKSGLIYKLNPIILFALFIGEVVLVGWMSARVTKLKPSTAKLLFMLYAVLNGITFSLLILAYSEETLTSAFLVTSITFGIMALYGFVTKTNLSGVGSFLYFAVIGLVVMMVINMFMNSGPLDYAITIIGLLVFWGLVAYDTQKLKSYFLYTHENNPALESNFALFGALSLYLDFVNIFIFLLRLFGGRD